MGANTHLLSRGMQNCFREYPEIYGAELEPEDEEEDGPSN